VVFCNVFAPLWLWSPRIRRKPAALFVIAMLVLIGMWFERFMLIVNSLFRPYLPSSWGMFYPTLWDLAFLFGSIGIFLLMFTLFVRWLPVVATYEMRKLVHELKEPG
jgi:molybdopterin-containing oxidoreductase family membrane subunit